jgi:hypothetical protein
MVDRAILADKIASVRHAVARIRDFDGFEQSGADSSGRSRTTS